MADTTKNPFVPLELVEWLEAMYPVRPPEIKDSGRKIWKNVGIWWLIQKLRRLYEENTESQVLES